MLNMREIEAQAKALAPVFGRLLEQAKDALREEFKGKIAERDERIAVLEKALVESKVDEDAIVEKLFRAIPKPKDGEPGKDADIEGLKAHLADLVELAVKALPVPQAGKDADMDALRSHLDGLVKAIPIPAAPAIDEIAAHFERRFSDLTLSWERQARDVFEKAADRMPVPKDGRDALPLESIDMVLGEDGRTVKVVMQAGETILEKSIKLPALIDRGVFSAEKFYEQGDGTTYGGCYWIAQKDAPEGVPGGSPDWRLAVKKGRDGKDLRDNASRHDPSQGVSIK
ncbi:hypothetical protein NNO07_18985 [Pseudomonas resinovorans]|uniref:Phage protein n=1 Tax=Metapseudomonas resinovorans TaxID=53412 RepID=A0ABT4Y8F8_METRE|nr:hypothetical protein [Pseudomonas resinovorans]MDA8485157.1 hypothetical protein [Pseudomonas resinovorans]